MGPTLASRRSRQGAGNGRGSSFSSQGASRNITDTGCGTTGYDDCRNPNSSLSQGQYTSRFRNHLSILCSPQSDTKKKSLHATEQTRPDVADARHEFIKRQPSLDPERLHFLDETSTNTKMTRTHGRCARGHRLVSPIPHGHWKTTTLVMCLTLAGVVAPYVIDGAMNGQLFLLYVQQILAPCLSKGDILVLDNVPFHKVAGVREAVEARGARLLYLPPYSPDLNPIEKAFSKIKSFLRKEGARTKESLWLAIGMAVEKFNYTVCCNLFKCSGYAT